MGQRSPTGDTPGRSERGASRAGRCQPRVRVPPDQDTAGRATGLNRFESGWEAVAGLCVHVIARRTGRVENSPNPCNHWVKREVVVGTGFEPVKA